MKILTGLVVAMLLTSCAERSSDDSQVRELIVTAENAAEARDASDVLEVVAADYGDSNGFDRAQLRNFLRAYFLAHPKIEVLANVQDLQFPVAGLGRARIAITVLPSGDHATLQVEFRKQAGEWAVARADRIRD